MINGPLRLIGGLTIEGPFLEQVWAARLLKSGYNVQPRYETLGTHHDVLIEQNGQAIMYECTGQAVMTTAKVDKFANDAADLHQKLRQSQRGHLCEAVLVSATRSESWQPAVREAFETQKTRLARDLGIKISSIEDTALLNELLLSGILGVRLVGDTVYFIGPEDWGIRWNQVNRRFSYSQAPLNINHFMNLPHAFFPSHYWEMHYRKLIEEAITAMNQNAEGHPAWHSIPISHWTYPYQYGLKWGSSRDLVKIVEQLAEGSRSRIIMKSENGFILHEWSNRRDYYSIHIVDISPVLTRDVISALKGYASRLIESCKQANNYLDRERFSLYFYSASESWSPLAWAEAREISDPAIYFISVKRGNELLLDLLNGRDTGLLGFTFVANNQITLIGPGENAIRRTQRGLEMSPGPSIHSI